MNLIDPHHVHSLIAQIVSHKRLLKSHLSMKSLIIKIKIPTATIIKLIMIRIVLTINLIHPHQISQH